MKEYVTTDCVAEAALARQAGRQNEPRGKGRLRPPALSQIEGPSRAKLSSTVWLRNSVTVLLTVLREIFDESAYTRFLNRTHLPSSRQAYAAFRHEHELSKARKPRCC